MVHVCGVRLRGIVTCVKKYNVRRQEGEMKEREKERK